MRYEHMNKEVHCFQQPENLVRTLRKWIMESKYLTANEISGFATAAPPPVAYANAAMLIIGDALQPSAVDNTELNIAGSTIEAVAEKLNQGTVLSPWTITDNFQRGQRGSNSVWIFSRLNIPMFARGQGHLVTPEAA